MSNKEELILDILERIHEKVEKIDADVADIKIQQALHDAVVKQHESRSTSLENRAEKLEKDAQFFRNAITVIVALGTLVGFILEILPLLK